jgi:hypothetical protein
MRAGIDERFGKISSLGGATTRPGTAMDGDEDRRIRAFGSIDVDLLDLRRT